MAELEDLYRELILEHARRPRGTGLPALANRSAERDNALCGDHVRVGVELDASTVLAIGFEAQGCALSIAAASLMAEAIRGQPRQVAHALCQRHLALIAARSHAWPKELGNLGAFAGVARFPERATCAALAWHALRDALET